MERTSLLFQEESRTVLTATGEVSHTHVRSHLNDKWGKYTAGLHEQMKILIFCGVHGGHDGKIGGDAHNVEDFRTLAVRSRYHAYAFSHFHENLLPHFRKTLRRKNRAPSK